MILPTFPTLSKSLSKFPFVLSVAASIALVAPVFALPPDLSKIGSPADLEAVVAKTSDPALKKALQAHSKEIVAAAAEAPHVEAVAKTVEGAKGKVERANNTPE